jgi:Phosphate-selective porin O and P
MLPRLRRPFGFALAAGLALALLPDPARAQVVVKVNDTVNFRLGFQLQGWAEYLQDPISTGYQQSFFLRRVRLIAAGNLAKDVSFFFQTDNPNMGKSTAALSKAPATNAAGNLNALNSGLIVQDAFGEWRVFGNDQFIMDVGKMLMPFTRNSLQSTSSHLSLDGGTFTFLQSAAEQGDAGRDVGVQVKSYLADDHLEIRTGVFDGFRAVANTAGAGSRNSPRFVGRAVYNIFDTEKGYVPIGTNLGKKRILAFGGGFDTQGSYNAYGGDIMVDLPIGPTDAARGQNAVTAHVDYIHYDGGCGLNATGTAHVTNCLLSTLFKQEELFTDLGFYFVDLKLQPFIRFEWDGFTKNIDHSKNSRRYMGGLNYYVAQQNLKITAAWERIVPNVVGAATWQQKNTNHFVVQFQIFYF